MPPQDSEDGQDFGPEMPPDDDDDDDVAGDDEGRFFGGGISKQESEILDYVQNADVGKGAGQIDAAWLRKTALNFERLISKNAELRAKFSDDPKKFITSEADLDADIKALSVLSEHPELYGEFVKLGCVQSLVGLLAHENTDIAIDAIEVIGELTDEDVSAEVAQWNLLVDSLMEADLVGLLASNLTRLDEDDESDRNGVYYIFGILENLCSSSTMAERLGQQTQLLQWLLQRIQRTETLFSQNKQYAAEILAILAQNSTENRGRLMQLDAVDLMLQLVAPYRKRDPERGGEEEEFVRNLFESLTCFVDEPEGKTKFLEAEGPELCFIMLKSGKMSKGPALRLLDHAAGGQAGIEICTKIVEAGGLKALFTLFIKTQDHRLLEHLLALMASMLRLLPGESAERIRTLAKFVEKDYEKISKLIRLRKEYEKRVRMAEENFESKGQNTSDGDKEEIAVELLSRRFDAGLYSLQLIDVILAWLVAEDGGAKLRIKLLLAEQNEDLGVIRRMLTEQMEGLDTEQQDSKDMAEMLDTLIEFLG